MLRSIGKMLIKIHLGQTILQSAQDAYPYIIKLIHMGKKQEKNIIYYSPKRKRDGVKLNRSKIANESLELESLIFHDHQMIKINYISFY
ncbi:UNVERIFIED_CONTAM: hypothetical protein NCL1_17655 [Trichonephila clavipes]